MSATRRIVAFAAGLLAVFAAAFGAGAALDDGDSDGDRTVEVDPAQERAPDHTGTDHEGAG